MEQFQVSNMLVIRVLKERGQGLEKIFEKVKTEKIPNLMKSMNPQINNINESQVQETRRKLHFT